MNTKQEIVKAYEYLLIIKKIMMFCGSVSTLSLVFSFYIKEKNTILTGISLTICIINILTFLLLWYSVPKIRKHILQLSAEI